MMKCSEAVRMLEAVGCDRSPGDARRLKSHLKQCPECRERSLACEALDLRISEALDRAPEYRDQTDAVLDELVPYSRPRKPALRWAWAVAACLLAAAVIGYGLRPRSNPRPVPRVVVQKPDIKPILKPRPRVYLRHIQPRKRIRHQIHRVPEIRRQAAVPRPELKSNSPVAVRPRVVAETQVNVDGSSMSVTIKIGELTATRTMRTVSVPLSPNQAPADVERPPLVMTVRSRFASAIEGS